MVALTDSEPTSWKAIQRSESAVRPCNEPETRREGERCNEGRDARTIRVRLSTSSWTVQVGRDASEPGPSASLVVPSSTVDCEWAFKIKPDEAALVSWRCQYPPRPSGITIHTRAYVQGSQPEAARLATGGELGLSGSSLARRLEAGLGSATESELPRPVRSTGMMAVSQLRSGSAVASGTGAVLVPVAGILRSLPARLGSWPAVAPKNRPSLSAHWQPAACVEAVS